MKIVFVAAIFFAVTSVQAQKKESIQLSLEGIWSGQFDQKDIAPKILNTRPAVAFIRANKATNFEGILTLDMTNGQIIDTLFTNQFTNPNSGDVSTFTFFEDFEFSPDDSKILIKSDKQPIHTFSQKEFIFLWDVKKRTLKPVSTDGKISHASFSSSGTYVAYIRDNNLYAKNIETDLTTAITSDGSQGSIINGMADELYEDGFGISKMYDWSPSNDCIAFIKLNQGVVKKYPIIVYDKSEPTVIQKTFAKPGETITESSAFIYNIQEKTLVKIDVNGSNQYITSLKWTPDGQSILVERLNREQTHLELIMCNAKTGKQQKTLISEKQPDYILYNKNNIKFNQKNNSFYWLSEMDGYNHIYEVSLKDTSKNQITKGKWEVNNIEAVDTEKGIIYFMAQKESAMQKHLYKVGFNGKNVEKITDNRGWHEVWLSKDNKYFFDKSTTINSPSHYRIYKTNGSTVTNKALIENIRYKESIKDYEVKDCNFINFTNSKGKTINGWLINGEKVNNKKTPLLLYVYGGNNSQEVTDRWNDRMAMTFRYFANKGYSVACIDPTGTPGRGAAFRKATYNNLINDPIADLVDAKNYLANYHNIDKNNVTLMGWSYGGFLSSIAATKYAGSFNKYVAIAPVTSWNDYNAAFTERILKSPAENPEKYKEYRPKEYVNKYVGGLMLVHGSTDQNVHVLHSMHLAKELTESDSYYDIQIFTDKGHSLSDGFLDKTRMNLFKKIYKFLERTESN